MVDLARALQFRDPTSVRLSKHFLLSDFLGNHSVYTRGYRNRFTGLDDLRVANGIALCEHALEPILERHGPLSISYGFIDPDLSREIVMYQDPDKPSHHRWDLGAAADICVHGWTNGDPDDDSTLTAPIALAHAINDAGVPYSRLISYSESPYLCIAVKASEIESGRIRKAFYENRWTGAKKARPLYRQYSTDNAKASARQALFLNGLPHGWRGTGHPTYHGGGRRQMHHVRISKYTMLSDWLFDLKSIANGAKNIPNLGNKQLLETFYAVGDAYDAILEITGASRMSIIGGYVSPSNPYFDSSNDWRNGTATFSLVPPEGMTCQDVRIAMLFNKSPHLDCFGSDENVLDITVKL